MQLKRSAAVELAKVLEETGWDIGTESRECKKCFHTDYSEGHLYCHNCGNKLPKVTNRKSIDELYKALKTVFGGKNNKHIKDHV